jgi:hypothetical protein
LQRGKRCRALGVWIVRTGPIATTATIDIAAAMVGRGIARGVVNAGNQRHRVRLRGTVTRVNSSFGKGVARKVGYLRRRVAIILCLQHVRNPRVIARTGQIQRPWLRDAHHQKLGVLGYVIAAADGRVWHGQHV